MIFKIFKRKTVGVDYKQVVDALSKLEPKRMDRLVEIAKNMRINKRDLDIFCNGRPDVIDKSDAILSELSYENIK